jgi:hypothetical protein
MRNQLLMDDYDLLQISEEIFERHSLWQIARALLLAAAKRRKARAQARHAADIGHMSNRMRRDIGMPEMEERHFSQPFTIWDLTP